MNQWLVRWLGAVVAAVALGVAPVTAGAGPSSDNLLELAAKGGPSVGFGFGVSPIHWDLIAPLDTTPGPAATESRMFYDREPRGSAMSFDLKLRWPTAEQLEPYLFVGPALLVDQPRDLIGIASEPTLHLGAKAGAGFNWRLTKDATLFGSYDVTTTTVDGLSSLGGKTPATSPATGYDVMYGVRFRY
jgi:hypothetical protein